MFGTKYRWLGRGRRRCEIAAVAILGKTGPSGPGRNRKRPLRFCAPEIFCLVQGVALVKGAGERRLGAPERCSSGAVPGGVLVNLSRTPGEAQRSGFAGKRRSKGAGVVFAVRRKRRQADFATTSRHGQSRSPPAGGEIPCAPRDGAPGRRALRSKRKPGRRRNTVSHKVLLPTFLSRKTGGRRPYGLRPNSYSRKTQHILAPAGILSSIISRFKRSSPFSVWTAEMSMPLDSSPIIFRGGRLTMATRVLPTSSSGL